MVASPLPSSLPCLTLFLTPHGDSDGVDDQDIFTHCAAPSGMIQFFELASEMWFFCVAFDLAVSITNPFSSFKARSPSTLSPL